MGRLKKRERRGLKGKEIRKGGKKREEEKDGRKGRERDLLPEEQFPSYAAAKTFMLLYAKKFQLLSPRSLLWLCP